MDSCEFSVGHYANAMGSRRTSVDRTRTRSEAETSNHGMFFDSLDGSVLSSEWASTRNKKHGRMNSTWRINRSEEKGEEVEFPVASFNNCFTAKTSFLLPYQWSSLPNTISLSDYVQTLYKRTVLTTEGQTIPLWKEKTSLPHSIQDLDPHFREIIGWKSTLLEKDAYEFDNTYESHLDSESVCRHLILTKEALRFLFPAPCLVAKASSDNANTKKYSLSSSSDSEDDDELPEHVFSKKITVTRIELTVFPLGSAVLFFTLNWNPKRSISYVSIEELRTWLFLSKFRHKISNGFQGWRMNEKLSMIQPTTEVQQILGRHLTSSLFYGIPISISHIGNWLLLTGGEDVDNPPTRLSSHIQCSFHHTVVVLREQPSDDLRNEYLFHLRRALGQATRPPLGSKVIHDYDVILQHRKNRYLGISLEGCVSLSWPSTENFASDNFEIKKWHRIFLGVFLILSVHVLGEKSILKEFSNKSADVASVLKEIIRDDFKLDELSGILKKLFVLSGLVTIYTMQLSSDECGGHTEYTEFLTALRRVFRIAEQRTELEHEIEDILKLVQNDYIEGLIERQEMELTKKTQLRRLEYLRLIRKTKEDTRFTLIAYAMAGCALPLFAITAIFGSNIYDNGFASFWAVLGYAISLSFFVGVAFSLIPYPDPSEMEVGLKRDLDIVSFRYLRERKEDQPIDEIIYFPPTR